MVSEEPLRDGAVLAEDGCRDASTQGHASSSMRQRGRRGPSAARAFPPRVHSPFRGRVRRSTDTACWCLWYLRALWPQQWPHRRKPLIRYAWREGQRPAGISEAAGSVQCPDALPAHPAPWLRHRMHLTAPSQRRWRGGCGAWSALRPCVLCSHSGSGSCWGRLSRTRAHEV
jgi:hypothetical protein